MLSAPKPSSMCRCFYIFLHLTYLNTILKFVPLRLLYLVFRPFLYIYIPNTFLFLHFSILCGILTFYKFYEYIASHEWHNSQVN